MKRYWGKFKRFLHCLGHILILDYKHLGYDLYDHVYTPSQLEWGNGPLGMRVKTVPHSVGCTCGKVFWERGPLHYEGKKQHHER
jgi:hypothetical protein